MKNKLFAALLSLVILLAPRVSFADSERIREEFFNRLKSEQNFGPYELDVEVRRGVFTVSGSVASETSRIRVEEIASAIAGVDTVKSSVSITGAAPISPALVAGSLPDRILSQIARDIGRESYNLQVSENGEVITLRGTVDTTAGSQKISRIAADTAPGKKIVNQLKVKEELLTDEQLRSRVLAALGREPLIKTEDLQISASRGIVEIEGVRPNHREIDRILSVVVMVEGVKDVRSKLRIGG